WLPNIVMGTAAIVMLAWRARAADLPVRVSLPHWWPRKGPTAEAPPEGLPAPIPTPRSSAASLPALPSLPDRRRDNTVVVIRIPQVHIPGPRLLDLYVSREYLRVLSLGIVGLLGIFYISTFIDLVDKLFRGDATTGMLLRFFYFRTPQFVYYVIPMGVLVSTLVTVGVMTKNSELLVMRACGISLYRTAVPLLLFSVVASGTLFALQEQVLARANREADRIERVIRHWPPAISAVNRRWVIGRNSEIYHFDVFDPDANRFGDLRVYRLNEADWGLRSMLRASEAVAATGKTTTAESTWIAKQGWQREISVEETPGAQRATVDYTPFAQQTLTLEPPGYFKSEEPVAEMMTYAQLRDYIIRLRASGANVVPQLVALQRKIAFPFVTIIMTILAVPFAVTTGRRGAMYGIGVGIVLAITYWVTMSVSGALGAGGALSPMLAAWAPNILFSAVAAYLLLTVRT
ncbi:MAG: LptF/LptG family permease, partial [Vicinamibacterales bacterium]